MISKSHTEHGARPQTPIMKKDRWRDFVDFSKKMVYSDPTMHNIGGKKSVWATALVVILTVSSISTQVCAGLSITPIPGRKPLGLERVYENVTSDIIPIPVKKPNLNRPLSTQLLAFGQVPVPGKKPLGKIGEKLSREDAEIYRQIFSYQADGRMDKAEHLFSQLQDMRLRGHVLFQRYMHPTAYKSSFDELEAWMAAYADHPGAQRIYKLALAKMPKSYHGTLTKPEMTNTSHGYLDIVFNQGQRYKSPRPRNTAQRKQIIDITRQIRKDVANGSPTKAYKKLQNAQDDYIFDYVEFDRLAAHIARGYMHAGKLNEARNLATASAKRSGELAPMASWVGGLVTWRMGQYEQSAALFEITASSPYSSSWTRAAGAYWASRAHMRAGNHKEVTKWLQVAAGHPRTFYGLIATRALGWDYDFNWDMPAYTAEHKTILKNYPAVWRAEALVMAGQNHLAEAELRQIDIHKDPKLKEAILAYTHYAGMPSFSMRLAESIPHPDGGLYDAAFYPMSPWTPKADFKIDRALINAFIRQESRFNPFAESKIGATGLMQIMPTTATYIAKSNPALRNTDRYSLKDPQLNLEIGQKYIDSLLQLDQVNNELFSLSIAYNAGPGNLRKWKREFAQTAHDPLLFVESIPSGETRAFVERVLSNYWIYRLELRQDTPSLDSVAGGGWAQYVQLDRKAVRTALPKPKPRNLNSYPRTEVADAHQ